ncbi:sulfurtransferase [Rhodovibrio salinarum]|uniref:Rhodanese-like domain-containing protein n=1 Tax=Rhodovibrio salinarum TaxID=1087 RepID=A0A934QH90_9PROT|nr:sulfurtransferase [Rhodovibrio salinarum]MBK1696480.1 rhodanese-like domain-containing protein [Rhodovibrio salinarum]
MSLVRRWIAPIATAAALAITAGSAQAADDAQPLVDAAWVHAHKDDPNVVVLDVRNGITGDSRETFEDGHIPGAVYSNYSTAGWRTTQDGVPGQLPEVGELEQLIGSLGIDNDDHVVVVAAGENALDMGSATRVYWTFKVLGHDQVSVLNGGHAAYAQQYALAEGWTAPEPAEFAGELQPQLIADRKQVASALRSGTGLMDNRPPEQYRGEAKHPASAKPGTLPGARNVPQSRLTNGGTFASKEQIAELLKEAGLEREGAQITFCNTGHWASLGWFASHEILGNQQARMYDGSMTDWTLNEGEVEVGAGQRQ